MEKDIAKKVSNLMLDYGGKLDESLALVQQHCSEEEFKSYRTSVSRLLTIMLTDVMNPLYEEHPSLKPDKLD